MYPWSLTSVPSQSNTAISESSQAPQDPKRSTAVKDSQEPEKTRVKSADWSENETRDLLGVWGPKYSQLRKASQREKIKI